MTGVVVCNGRVEDYNAYDSYFDEADYIICADGGAYHLRRFNRMPDIMLGDFDSIKPQEQEYFSSKNIEIKEYPVEKGKTDSEIALDTAVEKGCIRIYIIGGIGTRLDHSLSNVFLLKKMIEQKVNAILVDERNEIVLIDESISLKAKQGYKVSLLPLTTKVKGVTTRGLYYPLNKAELHMGSTLGTSNEFSDSTAKVSIENGLLLVIMSCE